MAIVINIELATKLNNLRLYKNMRFQDLADKSGLGIATVKRMLIEGRFGEIDALERVYIALGLQDKLFESILHSLPNVKDAPYFEEPLRQRASIRSSSKKKKITGWF